MFSPLIEINLFLSLNAGSVDTEQWHGQEHFEAYRLFFNKVNGRKSQELKSGE